MVVKIFTKRKPGGQPIKTNEDWIDTMIEADRIETRRKGDKIEICATTEDEVELNEVNLDTHGYQIFNDNGIVIDRFVTNLREAQL